MINMHTRYISTNAPPPFSPAMYGNFQMLPKPMADPVTASMKVSLDDHWPWSDERSWLSWWLFINQWWCVYWII